MSTAEAAAPLVIILVADGARPDSLAAALDAGAAPALARLRDEGALHTVSSVFPSVTGPAYAPFLLGRFPGPVGLPALRWYDRERTRRTAPDHARSYVGAEMRHVDTDLDPAAPTLFELAPTSLGALNVIGRGLPRANRLGRGGRFALRAARTHFRGDVAGWLSIDRDVGAQVAERVRRAAASERPRVVFCALTGIDKTSHARGHDAPLVRQALGIVDETAAELRADAERGGWWGGTHLWIVSDHGHSPVRAHDDLAGAFRALGHRTMAHPFTWVPGADVAVMVSGNAMAHVYVELERRTRPWWPGLAARWDETADALLRRPSVDLLLLPHAADRCEVRAAGRGSAMVERTAGPDGAWRYAYCPIDGDPLGLGGARRCLTDAAALEACGDTDYPDALVQITHLAGAARSGDVIVSAARDWDLRARWEPIPHVSSHGALHREHMLVPLLLNRPPATTPRRTADVMPSALAALGLPVPAGLDGTSYVAPR
ncbi:type I phosphodiesterase/nucleotide pyrophosphatase [Gemmatirosa kalamazoonensis]|uniref:Type I phosphodiesterase/nucleotide pyrophosphatase n=1 Tax=Gemmatirosa kalamazoonensis TaxID=861299 RepID=W0RAV4_9BACT|nr:alkaline phosphatase family protein [Gemmatirosa kalamazoonensis]AHG87597.1 type I phosphodiesterase/nucleotide pyrophosphatase [Gemmatirosa kalamazoonensis]